ncbi:MAG: hypothetical protein DRH37_11295 [Deltaproteobacteria bacterium]|nr:MAG: hypothetical protein DRH37_11295 [Deltaproteobacteria bacterium]
MAGFYERLQSTATGLLTKFNQGSVAALRTTSLPGPNPYDPPVVTTEIITLKAAVSGVSKEYVDGNRVLSTDLQMIVEVDDHSFLPGDIISIDGKPVTMVRHIKIPAAGITVANKFIVRS